MEIFHLLISLGLISLAVQTHRVVTRQFEALRSLDNPAINGHSCEFETLEDLIECEEIYPLPPRLDNSGLQHLKDHPLFSGEKGTIVP